MLLIPYNKSLDIAGQELPINEGTGIMSPLDYKASGVDIDAADKLVNHIKSTVRRRDKNIIGGIGDFAAMYRLNDTVLVSGTDGVGTKLKIAFMTGKHDTVGIDLVAMNVNDILTKGARPLFFLDYFATGKLEPGIAENVIKGIDDGCEQAGCSLVGGETAEMPDFYASGEYDLAGFAVGAVKENGIIDGRNVKPGDAILGFPSSGIHSNGYSLVRRLFFKDLNMKIDDYIEPCGAPLGEVLLTPTQIYVREILRLIEKFPGHVHGMSHITGGGFTNINRISGKVKYVIETLPQGPPIFSYMKVRGAIPYPEMFRTFNMGVGFVMITDIPDKIIAESALKPVQIGVCAEGTGVEIISHGIFYPND